MSFGQAVSQMARAPRKSLAYRRRQAETMLALSRIRRHVERHAQDLLDAHGLNQVTPAQAQTLLVLFQERAPMTARALAEAMGLSEVTVGRFVHALVDAGWVGRQKDPKDRRAKLLKPTRKAYTALPRFIDVSNTVLDRAFRSFTRDEFEGFAQIVGRIRENLEDEGE